MTPFTMLAWANSLIFNYMNFSTEVTFSTVLAETDNLISNYMNIVNNVTFDTRTFDRGNKEFEICKDVHLFIQYIMLAVIIVVFVFTKLDQYLMKVEDKNKNEKWMERNQSDTIKGFVTVTVLSVPQSVPDHNKTKRHIINPTRVSGMLSVTHQLLRSNMVPATIRSMGSNCVTDMYAGMHSADVTRTLRAMCLVTDNRQIEKALNRLHRGVVVKLIVMIWERCDIIVIRFCYIVYVIGFCYIVYVIILSAYVIENLWRACTYRNLCIRVPRIRGYIHRFVLSIICLYDGSANIYIQNCILDTNVYIQEHIGINIARQYDKFITRV
ncbi:hypothetical protein T484DRAFT_1745168 [Baffinella frigidus]|nr:hypothetical protein T484DRAFT_1745168 [Cryptophyta sp. CCMP2293]